MTGKNNPWQGNQLPKLNVVGSIPIARSTHTISFSDLAASPGLGGSPARGL